MVDLLWLFAALAAADDERRLRGGANAETGAPQPLFGAVRWSIAVPCIGAVLATVWLVFNVSGRH